MKHKVLELKQKYTKSIRQTSFLGTNITVVSEELPHSESYALGFFLPVGSRDEDLSYNGIFHFIEHCAFRKTSKLNSKQIASKFESYGAYANAFTTQESTCFYVRALKDNFLPVMKLLSQITLDTVFENKDVEKEREIILEEIKSYDDDPEESIFDLGDKLIFGSHPMGESILGTEESLNNIDLSDLETYHNEFYKSGSLIISYSGPHSHEFVIEKISRLVNISSQKILSKIRNRPDVMPHNEIEVEKTVSQSHILLGTRIPGYDEDDSYLLPMFNIMFGDGMSSRLYQNLRDKYGIAYSIYSTLQLHSDCGVFYIYAATDKKKIDRTKRLIIEEIDKFLNQNLSHKTLVRAKEQLKSSIIMEQESLSARMQSLAKNILMKTDFEDINETIENINSIKSDEIKEFVAKHISPHKLSVVKMIGQNT
ncbi:pitrilysin family protein [Candidatus Kapaibacterium sp.]